MLDAVFRKGRQLAADPVLRRWLLARALKRTPAEPAFTPHQPPYLGPGWAGLPVEAPAAAFPPLPEGRPQGRLTLRLAGKTLTLAPGDEAGLMAQGFPDIETRLSLHRFAWVPLMDAEADPRWVGALWRAWMVTSGRPDDSWAWHPYTAAERACNLLTFGRRHGLPAGAAATLAAHAPAIAARLEWFGDHHTSNHCANNGRGLYLLGLGLGLPQAAEMGSRILAEEARRLFLPSGVLREGSTHYHLLLARQWASVWLAAGAAGRPEVTAFETTLRAALAVLPHFDLAGTMPLVGDVSPDCPPAHLFGLLPGRDPRQGWTGLLAEDERAALTALRDATPPVAPEALRADGWGRAGFGRWAGLWHAEPLGWSPMPGHGHQDCGAATIHFDGEPIFVDPGRGSYALAGEADPFVAAGVHGGLTLDGADPYPPNRPYYADAFRARHAGPAKLTATADGIGLTHGGYARLGAPRLIRRWRFTDARLVIEDEVEGPRGRGGSRDITRRLVTPLAVRNADGAAILVGRAGRRFRVTAEDCDPVLTPLTLWSAYGEGAPGTTIAFSTRAHLPWHGRLIVEVL